ncbi:MAG: MaoC family dehydratase [Leptospiraceae bacterium]|nr:MaoC family dehydratase [Leptospiraceae bacterium]MDW8305588.1 MaoC family dehydratase [Leptospiraceae bacterium]
MILKVHDMEELAPKTPLREPLQIRYKSYGRYLEDFQVGDVYEHPRGMTLNEGLLQDFATTFFEANPIYLNREYARAFGYEDIPASPLLVFNIILSLGVQNNSEKAYANLGYYQVHFLRPVYARDTLRAVTKIAEKRERGEGKPGIVTLNTIGLNQRNEKVIQYRRKIMVMPRPKGYTPPVFVTSTLPVEHPSDVEIHIPDFPLAQRPTHLTRPDTYYEDFEEGEIIVSPNGRTISDEHFAWAYRLGNTHPLHFDRLYTQSQSGAMSGEPIVYGGLIFAWLHGLASRDISENALWDLGYTEGYHTQPAKSGDTIYVIHRVLKKEGIVPELGAGIIQFQMVGIKDIRPRDALEKYGAELFIKENDKKDMGKEKIAEKIFEIERRLLIRSRG